MQITTKLIVNPDKETLLSLQNLIEEAFESFDKEWVIGPVFYFKHVLLQLAYVGDEMVGFKIGYGISKTTFYSWLGGVKTQYRRQGLAKRLADEQEAWVQRTGLCQNHNKVDEPVSSNDDL